MAKKKTARAKKTTTKKKVAKKQPFEEVTTGQEQPQKKGLLEEIEEMRANGDTSSASYIEKIHQMEVIFGVGETNPYGTNHLPIFEEKLGEMSEADMRALANRVGINPFYNKKNLKENLIKEFRGYKSRTNSFNSSPPQDALKLDPNNPQHAEALKIIQSAGPSDPNLNNPFAE